MFSGNNLIGFSTSAKADRKLKAISTVRQNFLPEEFIIAAEEDIEEATIKSVVAFEVYKKTCYTERALFLETIGDKIIPLGVSMI